jgi:hypothetical protein
MLDYKKRHKFSHRVAKVLYKFNLRIAKQRKLKFEGTNVEASSSIIILRLFTSSRVCMTNDSVGDIKLLGSPFR